MGNEDSELSLAGRTALITGGGSGIGRETALLMASAGATVVVCDLDPSGGEATLYRPDGATVLDHVSYAEQLPDRSYARWSDGAGAWSYAFEATPGTENVAPQLPRFAILNEIQTDNVTTIPDEFGDWDPWVEIVNPLPVPLALGGLELAPTPGAMSGWVFPDSMLAGGAYQIIWVDGEPTEGAWHANFALAPAGGFVGIVWPAGSAVVDSVTAISPGTDWSMARQPDSFGDWHPWEAPTPGGFNPTPAPVLFVNEFLARNESGLADDAGDHDDWLEIYNPNPFDVDLTGLHLTDDLADPTAWQFPSVSIRPHGYRIVWCDDEPGEGLLHATFKLGGSGEEIGLFGGAIHGIVMIDSYVFGPQVDDVSEGRETDGGLPWVFFDSPTPGAPNSPTVGLPAYATVPTELILLPAVPNPFGRGTEIRFLALKDGRVTLGLFDVTGRRIALLLDGPSRAGPRAVTWDGRDAAGRRVSSGVYFVRLSLGGETRTGRIVRVR